jgi:hypothetical protein
VHLESHVYEGLTRASVLAVDSADHIYLGGTMEQPADLGGGALTHAGGWDVAVVEWAPGMKHVFSNSYGAAPDEDVTGIGFDLSGNLWLAGYYRATIDFGGGPLVTKGGIDSFVAKLTP